jgi:hypothetical protein
MTRDETILRERLKGDTLHAIGERHGLCHEGARQIANREGRPCRRSRTREGGPSVPPSLRLRSIVFWLERGLGLSRHREPAPHWTSSN